MQDIFDELPPEEAKRLSDPQGPCALPAAEPFVKGQQLYREGSLALLRQGSATVYRVDGSGARLAVRALHPGEMFGAASVFGEWKKGASSVIAGTAGSILYLPEQLFSRILQACPTVAMRYIRYLTDRIRFLNHRMDAFAAGSTRQRLYEFLTAQADSAGVAGDGVSMAQLARMLHVGRTSLYRDLEELERQQLVRREGRRIILCKQ